MDTPKKNYTKKVDSLAMNDVWEKKYIYTQMPVHNIGPLS